MYSLEMQEHGKFESQKKRETTIRQIFTHIKVGSCVNITQNRL